MEGRLSHINGRARLAVSIRGIVSNRVMEAIITIPYELPEYQQFNNLFTGWIQDHQPSSLMSMELPGKGLNCVWINFGFGPSLGFTHREIPNWWLPLSRFVFKEKRIQLGD